MKKSIFLFFAAILCATSASAWSYKTAANSWKASSSGFEHVTMNSGKSVDVLMLKDVGDGVNICQNDDGGGQCLYCKWTKTSGDIFRGTARWNNGLYCDETVVIPEGKVYITVGSGTQVQMTAGTNYTYTADVTFSGTGESYTISGGTVNGATIKSENSMPSAGKPASLTMSNSYTSKNSGSVHIVFDLKTNKVTETAETPTEPEPDPTPEPVETETIYFVNVEDWTGTINVYAWTDSPKVENAGWPGTAATKETNQIAGHDVYSFTAEKGKFAKVIFNNNNGKQTGDLAWTAGQYICKNEWCADEAAVLAKLTGPVEYESVYFINVKNWTAVNIYTWSPVIGTWPGKAMTKEENQIAGYDVYSYTVEKGTTFGGMKFNEGNGKRETGDLTWATGKYYVVDLGWLTKEDAEAQLATPLPETWNIVGAKGLMGKDWDLNAAENAMTKQTDGTYLLEKKGITLTAGNYEYKAAKDHAWTVGVPQDGNQKLTISTSGIYDITFVLDVTDKKLTATATLKQAAVVIPTVIIAGDMNGWDQNKDKFTMSADSLTATFKANLTAKTYEFKMIVGGSWLSDGKTITRANNSTVFTGANSNNNTKITADIAGEYTFTWTYETKTLTVSYPVLPIYTVTIAAENGTVEGLAEDGKYEHGTKATLTATPAEGYEFVNWTVGGKEVSAKNPYTFTVTADVALVANFAKKVYTVTIAAENGTVEGLAADGKYEHGAEATLTATPAAGYHFVNWTSGETVVSTENPYTFTVTADIALVANFELIPVVEPEKPEPTYTENKLNTYAFGLESELNDTALVVTYRLNNSNATSVNVLVYKGENVVATVAGTTTIGVNTVVIPVATLPKGRMLTWSVEVNGTSVEVPTQEEKNYGFYCPHGLAIDTNPESENFGRILVAEAMHGNKGTKSYVSHNAEGVQQAGLYTFNPSFTTDSTVYTGGNDFTRILASNGYQPWRVKISEDGRIFVSSLDLNGVVVWEVSKDLQTWTPVIAGTNDATDHNIYDADSNFVAGLNCSMDVIGSGEDLKLLLYSTNNKGIAFNQSGYRLDEYALGTATTWTGTPTNIINGGAYGVVHTNVEFIYDGEGGYWFGGSRAGNAGQPNLVHINAAGEQDYYTEDASLYGGDGVLVHNGMLFKGKARTSSTVGNFGVWTIGKDADGKVTLTEKWTVVADGIGRNLNEFAVDYAENLYVVGNSGEMIIAYALPYSGQVVTPAASKYAFHIGELLPDPAVVTEMVGVVKRAVQNGESTIVLTHETDGTPHIYEITNGTILELLQNGVIARDPENAGDLLAISDIAVTEDGKLVATNYMITQSDDGQVVAGDKRGETRIYIWKDLHGAPSILFTSKMSSNWYQSKQGLTMAVKGTSDNMEIFMTGIHKSKAWARASSYRVINGVYEEPEVNHNDHYYFYDINDAIALETTVGTQYELNASPLGEMNWILDAELINPVEIVESATNNVEIATSVALTEDLGKKYNGATYVTVGEQVLMVAPFATPDGKLNSVMILDITAGFDAPKYVDQLILEEAVEATAAATAVEVVEGDEANALLITLVADATIYSLEATLAKGPAYQIYEEEITNLVIDLDNLVLIGGPSTAFQVDVYLPLGEYNMSEDSYQLTAESSIAVMGSDATFIDGYAYEVDAFTPSAKAVVHCEWNGMLLEFHLTMTAEPMEATKVVVENATIEIEKYQIFGDMYDYALTMTGNWINPEDGLTYPVLVEVPVYYPEATEPSEIMSTVTVGGRGDDDPWLGFGEGTLTVTTVGDVITATGIVQNPMAGVAIDITISGSKTPTAIDNATITVRPVKVIKNGQLIIINNDIEYSAQGAVVK